MTDGNPKSYYLSAKTPAPGEQIGIDFGSTLRVSTIKLLLGTLEGARVPIGAQLQYSPNGTQWTQIGKIHIADIIDLEYHAPEPYGFWDARYLRLLFDDDSINELVAIRSFGVVADLPLPGVVSSVPGREGFGAERVVDGDPGGYFLTGRPVVAGDVVTVDFHTVMEAPFIHVSLGAPDGGSLPPNAVLEHSADNVAWTHVSNIPGGHKEFSWESGRLALPSEGWGDPPRFRYLRLRFTQGQDGGEGNFTAIRFMGVSVAGMHESVELAQDYAAGRSTDASPSLLAAFFNPYRRSSDVFAAESDANVAALEWYYEDPLSPTGWDVDYPFEGLEHEEKHLKAMMTHETPRVDGAHSKPLAFLQLAARSGQDDAHIYFSRLNHDTGWEQPQELMVRHDTSAPRLMRGAPHAYMYAAYFAASGGSDEIVVHRLQDVPAGGVPYSSTYQLDPAFRVPRNEKQWRVIDASQRYAVLTRDSRLHGLQLTVVPSREAGSREMPQEVAGTPTDVAVILGLFAESP
ncbi:discoidin domain-containing protein, partial [Streptomyces formicae]